MRGCGDPAAAVQLAIQIVEDLELCRSDPAAAALMEPSPEEWLDSIEALLRVLQDENDLPLVKAEGH